MRAGEANDHRSWLLRCQLTPAEDGVRRASRHSTYVASALLRRALGERGCWPGRTLVGSQAAYAAFHIAVHADRQADLQRLSLQLIRRAVQQHEAPLWQWARLYDRRLVNSGRPQVYGTQYCLGPDGPVRHPIREPNALDDRRAKVKLGPAAEAMNALRRRLESDDPQPMQPDDSTTAVELTASAA